ncbi:iron complex transport system permease protein [Arcanobacterium wilhelmae]|uniref:Iron complex transport system permease protein n=1 Tax=Arcanobacterium wilhelmae TaxID=1803177 RepID=A0ABT9ND58_9ACTO|nr:iron chelate uptake ABC transporter family permease subunit [Arcanobacterium wilhelmae]MDP9801453.1 iron complex transport system permease protein [Arcanobacterium wilhelmae]WFN90786.1 iron chelate uptake ABC transporter family permease subunit [Arcanobacterium wilhelmae]
MPENATSSRRRLALAAVVTAALACLSLATGVYDVAGADGGWEIFLITRVPRTIAIVLAGGSMAIAGLIMQLMAQNRFVEPTTTGTLEWAGLGLLVALIAFPGAQIPVRMMIAIAFAFAGTLIFFSLLRRLPLRSALIVPIVGIMLGAVVSAFSTFLALEFNLLQSLGIWFTGSFGLIERGRYELLWIVAGAMIAAWYLADRFTVAGLGEEIATNVGLNYRRVMLAGVAIVAVVTGVVSVVVGSLPFLGLIVPNLVSIARGDNLRTNLPWVCLAGISLVLVCDIFGRIVIAPFEIPAAMSLAVLGSFGFIALLEWRRRHG